MEILNLSEEAKAHLTDDDSDSFGIDHANWRAWQIFLMCGTQWRATFGGLQGLDYSSVWAVMQIHGTKHRRRLFRQIQLLEYGALAALSDRPLDEVIG